MTEQGTTRPIRSNAGLWSRRSPGSWELPSGDWILHATGILGKLTDRWVDTQARAAEHYEARLLGYLADRDGASTPTHWLPVDDRLDLYLAYRSMFKTAGVGPRWLASAFRASPPLLLHAHTGLVAALLRGFSRSLDIPLLASFYGFDATKHHLRTQATWRRRYSALFSTASAVVVEGPAMAEKVSALGCPAERVHVVPLPADAGALKRVRARGPAGTFRACLAGRFAEKKGFDTGIRAFARALRGRDAQLLLVGGGELEDLYRAIVRDERIENQVEWGGRLPFVDYMEAIARCHVGLYPSRVASDGDSEGGAPVTLIEAQWLGLPALVSELDDLPSVAAPGSPVLPPRDVDAWADAIRAASSAPNEVLPRREQVREFARERYSPQANARAREAIYEAVASG